jgi:hypothetical protein
MSNVKIRPRFASSRPRFASDEHAAGFRPTDNQINTQTQNGEPNPDRDAIVSIASPTRCSTMISLLSPIFCQNSRSIFSILDYLI